MVSLALPGSFRVATQRRAGFPKFRISRYISPVRDIGTLAAFPFPVVTWGTADGKTDAFFVGLDQTNRPVVLREAALPLRSSSENPRQSKLGAGKIGS